MEPTIFDAPTKGNEHSHNHQRVCGLFYLHGINPGAVVGDSAWVAPIEDDPTKVVVHYKAIVLDEGEDQWHGRGDVPVPSGIVCAAHGEPHKAQRWAKFTASRSEVSA